MTIRLEIEYDGGDLWGWAAQDGIRTAHGELQRALGTVLRVPTALTVAGRTDRGVHAVAQVASYEGKAPDLYSVNAVLPADVAIRRATEIDRPFDARRMATSRTYCFRLHTRRNPSPFGQRHMLWWSYPIDEPLLHRCARLLVGEHDFTAFTPTETQHVRFVRRVTRCAWRRDGEILEFWIEADSFMRHMNRILMGTMLQVAGGRREIGDFARLLAGAHRREAGPTAPPQGLFLAGVAYPLEVGGATVAPPGWGRPPWEDERPAVGGAG